MTTNGAGNFEIPAEMRAFAEKSVEQAKQAFGSFITAAQHAASTADNQAANTHSGAKEVGELAIGFTKRNIAFVVRVCRKAGARQGFRGSDGAARRIREKPDGGAHRADQGIEPAGDETVRPALTDPLGWD